MRVGIIVTILIITINAQVSPSWARNNNIDAGESKPIKFTKDTYPAGSTFTYTQNYNKTDFTVSPRVMMGHLVFAFPTDGSTNTTSFGYNITMRKTNTTDFQFVVQTFGITILGLHFIYIAISPIYDNIYYMENYYL